MERMATHFVTLLTSIVASPETRISMLALMPKNERCLILNGFNQTEAPFPPETCMHQLFEAQVAQVRTPISVFLHKSSSTWLRSVLLKPVSSHAQPVNGRCSCCCAARCLRIRTSWISS